MPLCKSHWMGNNGKFWNNRSSIDWLFYIWVIIMNSYYYQQDGSYLLKWKIFNAFLSSNNHQKVRTENLSLIHAKFSHLNSTIICHNKVTHFYLYAPVMYRNIIPWYIGYWRHWKCNCIKIEKNPSQYLFTRL